MCDKDVVVNGKVVMEAEPLQLKRNIGLVSGVAYIAGMIIGDDVMSSLYPFSLTSRALSDLAVFKRDVDTNTLCPFYLFV